MRVCESFESLCLFDLRVVCLFVCVSCVLCVLYCACVRFVVYLCVMVVFGLCVGSCLCVVMVV